MILTIKAMKIASPKKDITDAIFPAYDRFFATVNTY
jgi:hypothetical protein